ncbi:carbohydrate ABC transporter membrane protein 1 (CUT1 family) [Bosea psychrotolerans]|uniref:Carbohydrate ABC transporter membrane protein 1 (CUT1 family) n=2 Tax=Bosea psychrotolerans TaxID=1871628 RepID=A0A2S4MEE3_9HYPH|nr:carbohydrate ABC transporter membrane protein 1 (CUT1 family) [Bosea psychrotolerans]
MSRHTLRQGEAPTMPRAAILDLARPSRRHWLGYLLLAPAVLLIGLIIVYPLFVSVDLSFQNVNIARLDQPRRPFTTANYERLFASEDFWNACWVTFKLVVIVSTGCFLLGMATALLVNNRFKGQALARLLVALPWAVPEVIAVVIFAWLFDSSFGLMNWIFIKLGLVDTTINWFSSPSASFAVVCVVMIWKGYPFVSIMLLAGLQSIPEDFYNAARVDGASAWQRLLNITIPSLMPVLGVTLVLVMLWVFRDFSIIYVLTGGGPLKATQSLSIMTYEQAFGFFKMGYASAIGVITLIVCVIASRLMIARAPDTM